MFNKIFGIVTALLVGLMLSLCIYDLTNDLPRVQDHHVLAGYCVIAIILCGVIYAIKFIKDGINAD